MRVGTSIQTVILWHYLWDHPHACGDKLPKNNKLYTYPGSSPCVWGQVSHNVHKTIMQRIIPMRVGTSRTTATPYKVRWDHPHACGDK